MAGFIAKILFKETLENKFGQEDPYFETVPATRLGGKPKKRRKANPPGLSDHDGKVLTKVKRRAYRLDMSLFSCCGIRFGWGSAIGIIPGVGDVLDMLMALMVLRTCTEIEDGLPSALKARMMFNIMLDFAVGLVPLLGDVADAMFRANTRNAAILEEHLRQKGKKSFRASGMPAPAVDPSDPLEYDRIQSGPGESSSPISSQPSLQDEMARPKPQQARAKKSGRSGRGEVPVGNQTRLGPRNELRDMEEGVVSHHPSSTSKKNTTSSRNARSSRR